MKQKKVRVRLRLSEKLNKETAEAAENIGISKNDFIILAIQEKLKKHQKF